MLINELNHRVKNTLASVQSIARQTAKGASSIPAFRDRLEQRLMSLADAVAMRYFLQNPQIDRAEKMPGLA